MRRRDSTTYLCGGIFDDLCLIGQSLLLQGKRPVSGGLWGSPKGGDPLERAVGPPSSCSSSLSTLFFVKQNPHQLLQTDNPDSRGSAVSCTYRRCQGFACQAEKEENPGLHLSADLE